ncbi:MAG: phosphoglycerate mutase (2,3-diphosphoglycerate-independent) [Rhodospirillaceae bacterium]|nr:phosphoglycerate mutase (2,3-diphosphoglycerate-independent) [Rhodospirillaceae bacterium]
MARPMLPKPVVLCVLDGWGHRDDETDNAITPSNTPNFQLMWATNPHAFINTSGADVGLPDGQMGNSEVGHMNLGAGRVVSQDIRRIDAAAQDGSLMANAQLKRYIDALKESSGTSHLLGLLSPGGVHSHQDHLIKLAEIIANSGIPVCIHMFLDGRDTPPESAAGFVSEFEQQVASIGEVSLATMCGRFFAMDRDQRWDRVEKAYNLIVSGSGSAADDAIAAIKASYASGITDEFIEPVALNGYQGASHGDGILMSNFRADRARELLQALLDPKFESFSRTGVTNFTAALGVTEYSTAHNDYMATMFPPASLNNILASLIADAGKKQLRIAETEKYAHVTFFFNGGREAPFPGEDRTLIPSPKVTTYDLQPEMSAHEVTDQLIDAIGVGTYDFILVNYANPDMIGHTGILEAARIAIRTVDDCIGRLAKAVETAGGSLLITADHGNAETMRDPETGVPHTAHTLNMVPAVLVNAPSNIQTLHSGKLADIAPTLLQLLQIDKPSEMTGESLIAPPDTAAGKSEVRVTA